MLFSVNNHRNFSSTARYYTVHTRTSPHQDQPNPARFAPSSAHAQHSPHPVQPTNNESKPSSSRKQPAYTQPSTHQPRPRAAQPISNPAHSQTSPCPACFQASLYPGQSAHTEPRQHSQADIQSSSPLAHPSTVLSISSPTDTQPSPNSAHPKPAQHTLQPAHHQTSTAHTQLTSHLPRLRHNPLVASPKAALSLAQPKFNLTHTRNFAKLELNLAQKNYFRKSMYWFCHHTCEVVYTVCILCYNIRYPIDNRISVSISYSVHMFRIKIYSSSSPRPCPAVLSCSLYLDLSNSRRSLSLFTSIHSHPAALYSQSQPSVSSVSLLLYLSTASLPGIEFR
jgi:hypothetical protein